MKAVMCVEIIDSIVDCDKSKMAMLKKKVEKKYWNVKVNFYDYNKLMENKK